ncbi:MAG: hypothetical protein LAT52_07895 [Balneolales bacterium]|nr:hypothetical protein [Balneolales bacterium]
MFLATKILPLVFILTSLNFSDVNFLTNPIYVEELDTERLLVLDDLRQIHVYHVTEGVQASLLNRGRGPGETIQPVSTCALNSSRIAVFDLAQFKLLLYEEDNEKNWSFTNEYVLDFTPDGVPIKIICVDDRLILLSQNMNRNRDVDSIHISGVNLQSGAVTRLGSVSYSSTALRSAASLPRLFSVVKLNDHVHIFNNISDEVVLLEPSGNLAMSFASFLGQSTESKQIMNRVGERERRSDRVRSTMRNDGTRSSIDPNIYPRYMSLVQIGEEACFTRLKDANNSELYCMSYASYAETGLHADDEMSEGQSISSSNEAFWLEPRLKSEWPRSNRLIGSLAGDLIWSVETPDGVVLNRTPIVFP